MGRLISCREGKIGIARTCCSYCDTGESGGKMCALCGECCMTGFSSGGFVGGGNGQLNKRVVLSWVLFGNELPFFVGLYEEKFVWD